MRSYGGFDPIFHPDAGDRRHRVYILFDDVAPTIFKNKKPAKPYHVVAYSGQTSHSRGPVIHSYVNAGMVNRNFARIIVRDPP